MRIAPLADVKARLSAYLEQCTTEGPIVITKNGKAVAVLLVPMNDEDLECLLLARSPRFQALLANTTGINNVAVGSRPLEANTTGINNTASGVGALYANTTGINNTAVGYYAGYYTGLYEGQHQAKQHSQA